MDRISTLAINALETLPALLSVLPLFLIGIGAAWLLGVRGLMLPITAVPLLIGAAVTLGEAYSWLGVATSPLQLVATYIVVSALTRAALWVVQRRQPRSQLPVTSTPRRRWVIAGSASGISIGLGIWLAGIATTNLPPQGNDDIFHGYLVTRLLHATNLSPSAVAPDFIGSADPVTYYPYGIHLLITMAESITSPGVPAAMNGTWVLLLGVVLPFSMATAAHEVFPKHPRTALWAGILAPMTSGLYLLNGVMSYVLTLALLPGLLALAIRHIRRATDVPWVVLALALTSLFAAHPAVALSAAIIIALTTPAVIMAAAPQTRRKVIMSLSAAVVMAGLLTLPSYLAARSSGVTSQAPVSKIMDTLSAIRSGLLLATPWTPAQSVLGALVIVGIFALLLWRVGRGLIIAYALFSVTYVSILAGFSPIASLTGLWLGQWYRMVGVVNVLAPLLAAAGAELVFHIGQRFTTGERRVVLRATAYGALIVALASGALSGVRYILRGQSIVRSAWSRTTVTASDAAFFVRERRLVGDSQILNYWADGSTWMYALAGLNPAIPYDTTVTHAPWAQQMLNAPQSIQFNALLCRTIVQRNIRFAFAKRTLNDGQQSKFYDDLKKNSQLFSVVHRTETTALYAVRPQTVEKCHAG